MQKQVNESSICKQNGSGDALPLQKVYAKKTVSLEIMLAFHLY